MLLSARPGRFCSVFGLVLDDETVKCFGGNYFGSLGLGNLNSRGNATGNSDMGDSLPELPFAFEGGPAAGGTAVSNVFAGTYHTCVSGTEGGLVCFGRNNLGQVCGVWCVRVYFVLIAYSASTALQPAVAGGKHKKRVNALSPR